MKKALAKLFTIVLVVDSLGASSHDSSRSVRGACFTTPPNAQQEHVHGKQEADFFRINGQQAIVYPVGKRSSLENFTLPNYQSPKHFLVNQPIDIEIDPTILQTDYIKAHNSTIPDAKFIWKFGDGKSASKTRNKHRYTKLGSYILSIYIESKLFDAPLLFKTILIHILPNKDYKLPRAVITVNRQLISDHSHDALRVSFKEQVELEGTNSVPGSSSITNYFWDLSDRASSQDPKLKHFYNQASYNATPILRVSDSRGFISDAYVEIINQDKSTIKK